MFITVEGIDGSGKSTAVKIVKDHLLEKFGIAAKLTSDLNGSDLGTCIKGILNQLDVDPQTELALILAARSHNITSFIMPALSNGDWVICDRYIHSTFAYQGYARELGAQKVIDAHTILECFPMPDLVIHIDVSPQTAKLRIRCRGQATKYDDLGIEFYTKARQGFQESIGRSFSKEFITVTNESISIDQLKIMLIASIDQHIEKQAPQQAANDS